jgi:hypothetical protein
MEMGSSPPLFHEQRHHSSLTNLNRISMDSFKLAIKFFADASSTLECAALAPVFQSWIQQAVFPGHQLIDVADYKHVINGPGVMLIAHEGHFGYDLADGKPGLLYARQRSLTGSFEQKLHSIAATALAACGRIEQAVPGKVRFRTDSVLFRINDRLLAPNSAETFRQVEPQLQAFFGKLLGGPVRLEHRADPARPLDVAVHGKGADSVEQLLARLV